MENLFASTASSNFDYLADETFTRGLLETAPTLVYVFDLMERRNIFVSAQIQDLLGYTPEEIRNFGPELMASLSHPGDIAKIAEHHAHIRTGLHDGPFQIAYRLRHRDGAWKWLVSREMPFARDADGAITQIVGSALDATELKVSEERLAAALRSGDLGVHEFDVLKNEITWNSKTREIWGVGADDVITYEVFESAIHPDDLSLVRGAVALAMTPQGGGRYFAEFRVISHRDQSMRWVSADADVTFDGDRPLRFVGLVRDVTHLHLIQGALDSQRQRYQSITDNASTALFIMDERQHCTFMNPAAVAMTGYTFEETQGRPLHDVVHHTKPDGSPYPLAECPIDRAFPNNDRETGEDIFVHKDGRFYPVAFTASPLRNLEGKSVGTVIEVREITEQKRAAEALRESGERLRLAARAASLTYVTIDFSSQSITRLDNFSEVMGFDVNEGTPVATFTDTFLLHVHPEDRGFMRGHVEAIHQGVGPPQVEHRVISSSGVVRWIESRSHTDRLPNGQTHRIYIVSTDVTHRKNVELQLEFATRELMHRSKNLLAIIKGIANVSARTELSTSEFLALFSKRIEALSRSQDLLVHGVNQGVGITDLIRDQLSIAVGSHERASSVGPSVSLSPEAAQALGMALHELATNSLKHGALSTDVGDVAISWILDGDELVFVWQERGGPEVTAPARQGFGRTILERVTPSKLSGRAVLEFHPSGVRWELKAPIRLVHDNAPNLN